MAYESPDTPYANEIQSAFQGGNADIQALINAYGGDIARLQGGQPLQADLDAAASQSAAMSRRRGVGGPLAQRQAQTAMGGVQRDFMRNRDAQLMQLRSMQLNAVQNARAQQLQNLMRFQALEEQRRQQSAQMEQQRKMFEANRLSSLLTAGGSALGGLGMGLFGGMSGAMDPKTQQWVPKFKPEEVMDMVGAGFKGGGYLGSMGGAAFTPNPYGGY